MNAITNNINKAKQFSDLWSECGVAFSDLWSECGVAMILAGLNGKRIIIVACILIVSGYILMSGSSSNEQSFNPAIFSTRRIVIAPMLCLAGYLLIILGILRRR